VERQNRDEAAGCMILVIVLIPLTVLTTSAVTIFVHGPPGYWLGPTALVAIISAFIGTILAYGP